MNDDTKKLLRDLEAAILDEDYTNGILYAALLLEFCEQEQGE